MRKNYDNIKGTIRRMEGVLEIILLSLIYYVFWRRMYDGPDFPPYLGNGKYLLIFVYAFLVGILFYLCDSFKFGHLRLSDVSSSQFVAMFLVNVLTYFQLCLIANRMVTPLPMMGLMVLDLFVCFGCCFLFSVLYHHMYVPKDMVMIYGNNNAVSLKFKMDTRSDKYRVTKMVSVESGIEAVIREIAQHDAVIINDVPAKPRNVILKYCYEHQIRTYVVPKISDIIVRGAQDVTLFDTPLFLVKGIALTPTERFAKRLMDVVLCLIALIPAAPVMLAVALAIKLEDGGPVFYRQERVTKDGKKFDILKFRSMVVDAEKAGEVIPAVGKDPRITKVGGVIRAARMDELPQLLNILKGDMSVVGPRPERTEHVEKYSAEIPEFCYRLKVKGGLTGYAQIYGKYNTSPYDKLRLDLMYIENYSLMLDIKMILMTIRILFKRESTEGFDKARELEARREALLSEESGTEEDDGHQQ